MRAFKLLALISMAGSLLVSCAAAERDRHPGHGQRHSMASPIKNKMKYKKCDDCEVYVHITGLCEVSVQETADPTSKEVDVIVFNDKNKSVSWIIANSAYRFKGTGITVDNDPEDFDDVSSLTTKVTKKTKKKELKIYKYSIEVEPSPPNPGTACKLDPMMINRD